MRAGLSFDGGVILCLVSRRLVYAAQAIGGGGARHRNLASSSVPLQSAAPRPWRHPSLGVIKQTHLIQFR
jgi:hypothetical protein